MEAGRYFLEQMAFCGALIGHYPIKYPDAAPWVFRKAMYCPTEETNLETANAMQPQNTE
jgi:hypothetical protein